MDEKAPKIDDKKFAAHMDKKRKSLKDIRKRADSMAQNPKIVKSKKSTASMRNSAGLRTREGMENMCCKNCGDMYGKPTEQNKSCMYNAYDAKGKNWINAEKYHEAVVNPQSNLTKKQRQALASPAAKAKPPSQVSVKKAPFPIPDKKGVRKEAFDFKVNIDGFPEMFMSGNSPSEVKTHLRKLVKQPSMIQSVDRVTKADKKKHHRDKVNESLNEDAPCWDTHKQVGMKKKGNKMVPNCVPKNEDNVDELSMSRRDITKSGIGKTGVDKDKVKKDLERLRQNLKKDKEKKRPIKASAMSRLDYKKQSGEKGGHLDTFKPKPPEKTNEEVNEKVEYVEYKFKNERDAKAAKKYFDGIQLMSFDVNDDNVRGGKLMVDSGKKDMTKYHKEVMKKFRPKVMTQESYAPDEGTPEARKKASKMTPGQEGVMDFLKNVGNTVMYGTQKSSKPAKQPRVNTNRGSTSGRTNSIASRINFGGKYGNK